MMQFHNDPIVNGSMSPVVSETRMVTMSSPLYPPKQGLYDPQFEKDSCGVGFVANMDGTRSTSSCGRLRGAHGLRHRGACGCPESGDGAGSHEFLLEKCGEIGIELPAAGQYGVGMVFLPPNPELRQCCELVLERIIDEEGQRTLGWRDVPVDSSAIGSVAHEAEPIIRQIFIAKSPFLTRSSSNASFTSFVGAPLPRLKLRRW
jgi:glutamate synthase domain-containing protein 1